MCGIMLNVILTILGLFVAEHYEVNRTSSALISQYTERAAQESSMRYLENGRIKIGINLDLGGAVTYLSDMANGGKNMINSYDWGRQIQQSYYSGPWPYVGPNGERPSDEWAGLGWNPIQSGDAGGHRSSVLSFDKIDKNSMLVRSIPMQWPHKTGVAGECVFETLYTLDSNVVRMKATITNARSDKAQYPACPQEMPAVYTNGSWYKLVTYLGDKPFQGKSVTTLVDKNNLRGWPWIHFYTPENWVALVDKNGLGDGLNLSFEKDGALISPTTFWEARDNSVLAIEGAFKTLSKELILTVTVQPFGDSDRTDWLNWSEGSFQVDEEVKSKGGLFPKAKSISVKKKIIADGKNRSYKVDLKSISGYVGAMKSIKITMSEEGAAVIREVKLLK